MPKFVPNKVFLKNVLLHYFFMQKTACESHRLIKKIYGEHALNKKKCRKWFAVFQRGGFNLEDKERPHQPKKFAEELIDEQTSKSLEHKCTLLSNQHIIIKKQLKALRLKKEGNTWVPCKLKPSDQVCGDHALGNAQTEQSKKFKDQDLQELTNEQTYKSIEEMCTSMTNHCTNIKKKLHSLDLIKTQENIWVPRKLLTPALEEQEPGKVRLKHLKKFTDKDLEAAIDEKTAESIEEMCLSLTKHWANIRKNLQKMGLFNKKDKTWIPCTFKPRDIKRKIKKA